MNIYEVMRSEGLHFDSHIVVAKVKSKMLV